MTARTTQEQALYRATPKKGDATHKLTSPGAGTAGVRRCDHLHDASSTTGLAVQRPGRRYIGIDSTPAYLELSLRTRLRDEALVFEEGA